MGWALGRKRVRWSVTHWRPLTTMKLRSSSRATRILHDRFEASREVCLRKDLTHVSCHEPSSTGAEWVPGSQALSLQDMVGSFHGERVRQTSQTRSPHTLAIRCEGMANMAMITDGRSRHHEA